MSDAAGTPPPVAIGTLAEPWRLASSKLITNDDSLGALTSPDHSTKLAVIHGRVEANGSRVVIPMHGASVIDLLPGGVGAEGLTGRLVVIERSPLRVMGASKLASDEEEDEYLRLGRVLYDATFVLGPIELPTDDLDNSIYPHSFRDSGAPVRLANNLTTIVDKTRSGVVLREDPTGVAWVSFDVGGGRELEIHLSTNSTASALPSGGPSGSASDPASAVAVFYKRY